jgi:hypothetical protein
MHQTSVHLTSYQKILELKAQIGSNITIMGDFNTQLSSTDMLFRQKSAQKLQN